MGHRSGGTEPAPREDVAASSPRFAYRSPRELVARYALLLAGLAVMAAGVTLSIRSDLGTSPISSVPYALSEVAPVTVGEATILLHCLLVLLQLVVLRRRFLPGRLVQVPVGVAFGFMTDVAVAAAQGLAPTAYWQQWALCLAGVVLVAVGVSFEFKADVVMLAGEGTVDAFAKAFPIQRGNMKVVFDVSLVVVACAMGLLLLGRVVGVREGTVAAAVLVGLVARRIGGILRFSFA